MAMKLLQARERTDGFSFRVHLDETKLMPDLSITAPKEGPDTRPLVPDPSFIYEATWGKDPPTGQTRAQYITACRREFKFLAQLELGKRSSTPELGTVMAGEGGSV